MHKFLKNKKAFRTACAISIALVMSHFFAMSEMGWMPLTTLIVMQAPLGSSLYHGVQRFLAVIVVVMLGSLLVLQEQWIYFRIFDVTVGAVIGIIANLIFFPAHPDVEFRRCVIPILRSYISYFEAIARMILRAPDAHQAAIQKRKEVERQWLTHFPAWVYASGFALTMRQGHRHFLAMVQKMGLLLFSMHLEAEHSLDEKLRAELDEPLQKNLADIQKVLDSIISILKLKKTKADVEDILPEDAELEKVLLLCAPPSIELLDLSKDYMALGAFLYDLRDVKLSMLKMVEALR